MHNLVFLWSQSFSNVTVKPFCWLPHECTQDSFILSFLQKQNSPWFLLLLLVDLVPFIFCQFIFLFTIQVCFWLLFLPYFGPVVKSPSFSLLICFSSFMAPFLTDSFMESDEFTLQQTIDMRLEGDTPESPFGTKSCQGKFKSDTGWSAQRAKVLSFEKNTQLVLQ